MAKRAVRQLWIIGLLFAISGVSLNAQTAMSLDESIDKAQQEIEGKLPGGTKIVVLNFTSPSARFSEYVLEELTARLVNSGELLVVDRQNLDLIQKEMDFQFSGEVSDDSMQSIGQKLGAQSIVSGSFAEVGEGYRLRFRTLSVETAAIQVLTNANVKNDKQMSSMFTSETNIGLQWTSKEKWGKGAMNMAFGLGSFGMKDWVGGAIIGGAELVGVILIIAGVTYEVGPSTTWDGTGNTSSTGGKKGSLGLFFPGVALAVGSIIYGYTRPFTYDKSLAKKNGLAFSPSNINIALLPDENGDSAIQMAYKMSF
jgi:TolB-like protein